MEKDFKPSGLALTRKQGESIIVFTDDGRKIVFTIGESRSAGQTKVIIKAPKEFRIYRDELLEE